MPKVSFPCHIDIDCPECHQGPLVIDPWSKNQNEFQFAVAQCPEFNCPLRGKFFKRPVFELEEAN